MTDAPRTVRAAVGMGAITALSRVVGFVRVLVVAAVLGTTYLGNAFQSANSVSNVLFELIAAGALSAVLVPAFVDLFEDDDPEAAESVAGGVLGVAMGGLGAIALLGMVAAPLLARALTLGVPDEVAAEQRELVAFLLLVFLPQVVLYAVATVSTGVLHARRRFLVAAAAPMANTVVMVALLLVFRRMAGADPGVDLSNGERWVLAAAGTGGVLAFSTVLLVACRRSGFRLRPRANGRDPRVVRVLRQAGWGVVLHTSAGVLLAGALLAGAAVEGGVVAYQVAWVFFLAPYAIFAQPVHTAILPELVVEAREPTFDRFATSVRWALERIGLVLLPLSALMVALAGPGMRVVSFGAASRGDGAELLGVALASLCAGLFPYAAFLLLARAYYGLGDSRTPGQVAIGVAVAGAVLMAVGAPLTSGSARIAVIGLAHSAAHLLGCIALAVGLARRTQRSVASPVIAWVTLASVGIGLTAWALAGALLPEQPSRLADLLAVALIAAGGGGVLLLLHRLLGIGPRLTARTPAVPA